MGSIYIVKSKRPAGRYRAGRFFSHVPEAYELTDEEIAAVRADDVLVVDAEPKTAGVGDVVDEEPETAPKGKSKR